LEQRQSILLVEDNPGDARLTQVLLAEAVRVGQRQVE
jgi:hypothetical protein